MLTWSNTAQRKRGLTKEIRITKHIDILDNESDECNGRIDNVKLAQLVPDRIKAIVHCKS